MTHCVRIAFRGSADTSEIIIVIVCCLLYIYKGPTMETISSTLTLTDLHEDTPKLTKIKVMKLSSTTDDYMV